MKTADVIALASILYVLFILTPLLSMHVTHTAHLFSPALVGISLTMIEIFKNDR